MPTLLDLLGVVDHDVTMQGTSIAPLFEGRSLPDRPIFAEANQGRPQIAMRTARLKYVQQVDGLGREVYDLHSDKAERENLCAKNAAGCDSFSDAVDAWRTETRAVAARLHLPQAPNAVIDAATRERLRELGYER
jgi:arylsulfatase A-like enzyme